MDYENIVKMLEKNINYYASYVFRNSGMEFDDAKQEILLRMYKAFTNYNEKKSKYNTYFITVIKNECIRLIKETIKENKKKNKLFVADQINVIVFENNLDIDFLTNLKVFFEENTLNGYIFDKIESKLGNNQAKILKMLRNGYNLKAISEELNWSKQRVCGSIKYKIKPIIMQNFS